MARNAAPDIPLQVTIHGLPAAFAQCVPHSFPHRSYCLLAVISLRISWKEQLQETIQHPGVTKRTKITCEGEDIKCQAGRNAFRNAYETIIWYNTDKR